MTTPDDQRWVVRRRFLFKLPSWRGFRFGAPKREEYFEPARPLRHDTRGGPRREVGAAADAAHLDPRRDEPVIRQDRPRRARYIDPYPTSVWIPGGGTWSGGSGGSAAGGAVGSIARAGAVASVARAGGSGSIARGVGGAASGGGGGGKVSFGRGKGGGGGAAAAGGGAVAALGAILKYALIVVAVILAAAFLVFVGFPALIWVGQLLLFAATLGVVVAFRALTGRPWIVEAVEARDAPTVHAWRVKGFRRARVAIDEVAEQLLRGDPPAPIGGEHLTVVEETVAAGLR